MSVFYHWSLRLLVGFQLAWTDLSGAMAHLRAGAECHEDGGQHPCGAFCWPQSARSQRLSLCRWLSGWGLLSVLSPHVSVFLTSLFWFSHVSKTHALVCCTYCLPTEELWQDSSYLSSVDLYVVSKFYSIFAFRPRLFFRLAVVGLLFLSFNISLFIV